MSSLSGRKREQIECGAAVRPCKAEWVDDHGVEHGCKRYSGAHLTEHRCPCGARPGERGVGSRKPRVCGAHA